MSPAYRLKSVWRIVGWPLSDYDAKSFHIAAEPLRCPNTAALGAVDGDLHD
jgi:hypothetical protein